MGLRPAPLSPCIRAPLAPCSLDPAALILNYLAARRPQELNNRLAQAETNLKTSMDQSKQQMQVRLRASRAILAMSARG